MAPSSATNPGQRSDWGTYFGATADSYDDEEYARPWREDASFVSDRAQPERCEPTRDRASR